jgi:hypothetical protein
MGMSSSDGEGGMGIVGMEYSFGNAWPTSDGDSRFVGRGNNRELTAPSNVGLAPATTAESFEETEDAGETPRILDSN